MNGGFCNIRGYMLAGASIIALAAWSAGTASAADDEINLKVGWKGGPEFSTVDGAFKFKVRGRLQADGVWADQDETITGAGDVNATEIRRAMIGVEGVLFHDWKYIFETLFYDDKAEISDAAITYTGLPVNITFGQFKTYNSLEELTSSRFLTFIERAAFTDAFDLERQIGVGLSIAKDNWTLGVGGFGANANDVGFDEGSTFSARVSAAPINTDGHVLHVGAHVRHRDLGDDLGLWRYSQRAADLHLTDRFVDTGSIGESDTMWGLEAAWVSGPFSVQAEYSQNHVEMPTALGGFDLEHVGWYVDASWFLTGESRKYSRGTFSRIKVLNPVHSGGHGAWQIAARYDYLDLSDKAAEIAGFGAISCAKCGEQETWLFALNWYPNDYARLMLNVNHSEVEGGINDGAEITAVGLRAQVDW